MELLEDALAATRVNPDHDFLRKITEVLMRQAYEEDTEVLTMRDGTSIMEGCAQVDPRLCLAWRNIRGAQAWIATRHSPYPLNTFIATARAKSEHFAGMSPEAFEGFWNDAVRNALPLNRAQGDAWQVGKPLNDLQREQLNAQNLLIQYCLSNEDGLADIKTKALIEHDALFTSRILKKVDTKNYLNNPHLSPTLMLLDEHTLQEDNGPKWISWWENWGKAGNYLNSENVIPYLEQHGVDSGELKNTVFADELRRKTLASVSNNIPATAAWKALSGAFRKEQGWDSLDKEGFLIWQSLVMFRPSLLPAVLNAPPPGGLGAQSPNQGGLWDRVIDGLCINSGSSATALNTLARRLPIVNTSVKPLLWRWWAAKSSPHDAFVEITGQAHPHLWIGDSKEQRKGGIPLLASLCDSNKHSQALRKVRALLNPSLDLQGASNELKLIACIIQEVVASTSQLNGEVEDASAKVIPAPKKIRATFLKDLENAVAEIRSDEHDYEDEIAERILAVANAYVLELSVDTSATPTSKRPSRRF